MADRESDLGIEALEIDLDALFDRYCKNEPTLLSNEYCSDFCKVGYISGNHRIRFT